MTRRPFSPRSLRRQAERTAEKLTHQRERLASLEAGGTPERPLEVESASLVEPRALRSACLRCGEANRLREHAALNVGGQLLRVARLSCSRCGMTRDIWFRIVAPRPN